MGDEPERAGARRADDLYAAPLDQFTAARDALARRLRGDGEREAAAAVAKLRRPPATAWALNQVARDEPAMVERMLAAGQALRAATEDAMRGDPSGLRAAQAGERDAVHATVDAAMERLKASGRKASDALVRRLAGTLRSAIVDSAVAGQLRAGVLDADHETSGLGLPGLGLPGLDPGAMAPPRRPAAHGEADREEAAQRRAARARRGELEAEAERLERRAERLDETARNAEARAVEARAEADEARRAASEARRRLEEDEE